jgi:hypothetical protein
MSLSPAFRYSDVFEEAFQRELDTRGVLLDDPDHDAAATLVSEAIDAAWAEVRNFATTTLLTEAKRRQQEAEHERRRRELFAEHRARDDKEGRRALRKLFGRKVGNAIALREPYVVIESGAFMFATPEQHETRLRAALGGGGIVGQAEGIRLGKVLQKLDGGVRLDGVLADEDAISEAVAMVQRAEQERREAETATRRAQIQAVARKRDEARQLSAYGTVVPDE